MEEHPWSPWVGVTWGSSQEGSEPGKGRKVKKKEEIAGDEEAGPGKQQESGDNNRGSRENGPGATAQTDASVGRGEDRAGER